MRPSYDLESMWLAAPPSHRGTERHTLADAPAALQAQADRASLAEDFFSAGDEGRYEGGPANVDEVDNLDLEETPVAVVVRTPEMDARRARFARGVAVTVGCFAAVLAIGLVRGRVYASSTTPPERAPAAVAARAVHRAPREAKPEPLVKPEAKSGPRVQVEPKAEPEPKVQVEPAPKPPAPSVQVSQAPRSVAPTPTPALPSVANFAARAGDAPRAASKPPTASFAPIR